MLPGAVAARAAKRKGSGWVSRGVYLTDDGTKLTGAEAVAAAQRDKVFQEQTVAERRLQLRSRAGGPDGAAAAGSSSSSAVAADDGDADAAASAEEAFFLRIGSYVPEVAPAYREAGVRWLYPWQRDCLLHAGGAPLQGHSLVYTAPTSGGKTLVAEMLVLLRLLKPGRRRALFVVPLVSLVTEKVRWLQRVWGGGGGSGGGGLSLSVRGFYQNKGGTSPDGVDVAVCTIERANGLLNRLVAEGRASELALLVVDELHLMGEPRRGYLLESMILKARLACTPGGLPALAAQAAAAAAAPGASLASGGAFLAAALPPPPGVQIVGMSATLPNLAQVAAWVGGTVFVGRDRPLPLREALIVDGVQYDCGTETAGAEAASQSAAATSALPVLRPTRLFSMPPPLPQQPGQKPAPTVGQRPPPAPAMASTPASAPATAGAAARSAAPAPAARQPLTTVAFPRPILHFELVTAPTGAGGSALVAASAAPRGPPQQPTPPPQRQQAQQRPVQPADPLLVRPPHPHAVVASLCAEAVAAAHSTLVFCASRKQAQEVARKVATALRDVAAADPATLPPALAGVRAQLEARRPAFAKVLELLALTPFKLDAMLKAAVPSAVAFHHAGLTTEEREILEAAFRSGHLLVLVTTPTLAAGVNLPAQRVVFAGAETYGDGAVVLRDSGGGGSAAAAGASSSSSAVAARAPWGARGYLDAARYRQMAGRAGRTGLVSAPAGEVFMVLSQEPQPQSGSSKSGASTAAGSSAASSTAAAASSTGSGLLLHVDRPGGPRLLAETTGAGAHMPRARARLLGLLASLASPPAATASILSGSADDEPFDLATCESVPELAACTMVAPFPRLTSSFAPLGAVLATARQLVDAAGAGGSCGSDAVGGAHAAALPPAAASSAAGSGAATGAPPPEPPLPQHRVGFRRLLLELVVCGLLPSLDEAALRALASCTLLAHQARAALADALPALPEGLDPARLAADAVFGHVRDAADYLLRQDFVRLKQQQQQQQQQQQPTVAAVDMDGDGGASAAAAPPPSPPPAAAVPTQLGVATFLSALSPEEAVFTHGELARAARGGLCLQDDLHALALLTPPSFEGAAALVPPADWHRDYLPGKRALLESRVAELVGCDGATLRRVGDPRTQRLYAASLLRRLLREEPLDAVAADTSDGGGGGGAGADGIPRGTLQAFQNAAATYAGQVVTFARELHWDGLAGVLAVVARQLDFGVQPELLPLMALPSMTPLRARRLFGHGFKSVPAVAAAGTDALAAVLQEADAYTARKARADLHSGSGGGGGDVLSSASSSSMERVRAQADMLVAAAVALLNSGTGGGGGSGGVSSMVGDG